MTTKSSDPFIMRKVRSVDSYYERKPHVYDISVEDGESFVTGLCTAHNCHRIGQRDSVLVQHLVLEGSLDAVMAKRVIEKQKVIDSVLNTRVDVAPPDELMEPEVDTSEPYNRPATVSTSRQKIAEMATHLTQQDIRVIQLALQCIAGMDGDFARIKNDVGFNRLDADIGHDLAKRSSLSPKQAALALKIARKYVRQMPSELVEKLKGIQV